MAELVLDWDRSDGDHGGFCRSNWLAAKRVAGMTGTTLKRVAVHFGDMRRATGLPHHVTRGWHTDICRQAGVDVRVTGTPLNEGARLYVANHASYIDVIALGSVIDCSFIAKAEVESWPVFGWLAKQQRTLFVERRARKAADHRDRLKTLFEQGESLVLFPEGTSSDGSRVLPFRSSLFDAASVEAAGAQVAVQPVSIAYTQFDGMPMERWMRPFFAWYGDTEFGPHFWHWLGFGRIGVDLVFHAPVRLGDFASRKELAQHCQGAVARGLEQALAGRVAD